MQSDYRLTTNGGILESRLLLILIGEYVYSRYVNMSVITSQNSGSKYAEQITDQLSKAATVSEGNL